MLSKIKVVKSQQFENWSTPAKHDNDTYWLSVQFKKGEEPKVDKADIVVKDGFFSCYAKKDGTLVPKFIVMDYYIPKTEK